MFLYEPGSGCAVCLCRRVPCLCAGLLCDTHDTLCCRVWAVLCRENDDDSVAFLANLRAGKYKALVLDAPVIDMWVAENTNCDLFAVGDR